MRGKHAVLDTSASVVTIGSGGKASVTGALRFVV
jgi:hypothetical protein